MAIDKLIRFYQTLTPASLGHIADIYSDDVYFKDPFNEVLGLDAVTHIFAHMFEQVDDPRFLVTEVIVDGSGAMLVWTFTFAPRSWGKGKVQTIRGASHVRLNTDGRVNYHRDYWDAAEELYMKLPLIGGLLRFLRRMARS
jgi:hypothetical protein